MHWLDDEAAWSAFIADLSQIEAGQAHLFRLSPRVKKLSVIPDVYEMSWAPDGRATFAVGDSVVEGKLHIVWLRIGGHDILP